MKIMYIKEAVETHNHLNPKIWDDEKHLFPEVKNKIVEIVNTFIKYIEEDGIKLDAKTVWLLGSNANYNYTEESDLDIHIIADESFDCSEKHLQIIYNAYKSLFNNKYSISIKGIDVELYVENKDALSNVSTGIYDVLADKWIKEPAKYNIPEIDNIALDKEVNDWEDKYFEIKLNPAEYKINKFIDDIYEIRQKSIQKEGEFGLDNLVFKEIRRRGYLQDLKDLKDEIVTRKLSLESLDKDILEESIKILGGSNVIINSLNQVIENFNDNSKLILDNSVKCYTSAFNNILVLVKENNNKKFNLCFGYLDSINAEEKIEDLVSHCWIELDNKIIETHLPNNVKRVPIDKLKFEFISDGDVDSAIDKLKNIIEYFKIQ